MTPKEARTFPTYAELLDRTDAPAGSSWGLFGADDQLGTLNFLSPEKTLAAAHAVQSGQSFSLDLRTDAIAPSLAPTRKPLEHHIFQRNDFHHDEWVDRLFTQYGTQIDGLRHIGHPDYGFYNGYDPKEFKPGTELLSIHHFADAPMVGRGVLIDVARYMAEQLGTPIDQLNGQAIPIEIVEDALRHQGTSLEPGDIVILRFGWLDFYRNTASDEVRTNLVKKQFHPGLLQSHDAVAWLWNNRIALIASDNFALESWPAASDSPFFTKEEVETGEHGPHAGIMHRAILPLLGLPIGELWDVDTLADACAGDGRYEFLITISPIPLVGGVGSPANVTAIR